MLKVGIIGYGGIGHSHLACWAQLKDYAQVVAVADIREEKREELKDRKDLKLYADGADLIENEDVDIIDICIPTFLHTKYAVMAMEKGCDVFLEKPVCLNEEEAQLLIETQKKTGAKVQVGLVVRFEDEYSWVKDAIDNNTYGKVVCAEFHRLSQHVGWSWDNWYATPEKSGTVALDMHIHDVDFVRYMMGKNPDSVKSHATRDKDGVIQQIFSTYKYGDVVINTIAGWDFPNTYTFGMPFLVKFERATVTFNHERVLTVYTNDEKFCPEFKKEYEGVVENGMNLSIRGPYVNELKWFVTETIPKGNNKASLEDGIESARLAWKEIECAGGIRK